MPASNALSTGRHYAGSITRTAYGDSLTRHVGDQRLCGSNLKGEKWATAGAGIARRPSDVRYRTRSGHEPAPLKKVRPAPGGEPAAREPGLGTGRGGDVTGLADLLAGYRELAVSGAGRGSPS